MRLTRVTFGSSTDLDRIRQVIVEAGPGIAHVFAEAQHDAEFVGLHAEEPGQAPERDRSDQDQAMPLPPRLPPGSTLRSLSWLRRSKFFEVGRGRAAAGLLRP